MLSLDINVAAVSIAIGIDARTGARLWRRGCVLFRGLPWPSTSVSLLNQNLEQSTGAIAVDIRDATHKRPTPTSEFQGSQSMSTSWIGPGGGAQFEQANPNAAILSWRSGSNGYENATAMLAMARTALTTQSSLTRRVQRKAVTR